MSKKIGNIVNGLLLVWFFCAPMFWHIGALIESSSFYDTFIMLPYAIVHLVTFYMLALLSMYINKIHLYHILLLNLYFPFIQMINFPFLTYRDVYLHAAPAKNIIVNGKISYFGAASCWPASYILYAESSIISGSDLIFTNYLLNLALTVLFTLVLYSFAKALENNGYRIARYSAVLFLCLFFNHFSGLPHYDRNFLGFIFILLLFFVFINLKGLRGRILQLIIVVSTVITHPFQSIAIIGFLVSFSVLAHRVKRTIFSVFSLVTFISWFFFIGSSIFFYAINLLKSFLTPEYLIPIAETFFVKEVLPWWGIVLRDFFKYSLITLLAVATFATALVVIKKPARYKNNALIFSFVSFLPMSIVMFFALLLLPEWKIWRFTLFAAFPAAFTSFILIEKLVVNKKLKMLVYKYKLLNRRFLISFLLLYIMSLSTVVTVLRFESNFYFGEINHPSELSALSFFLTYNNNSTVNIISWRTGIYSTYFNYNSSHKILRLWSTEINALAGNTSKFLLSQCQLINKSNFVIRGIRDSFTFSRVSNSTSILKVVDKEIFRRYDSIYSNGYYSIHKRITK